MSLETSKKVLKVSGIICLIFAVIFLVMGLLLLFTGGTAATSLDMNVEDNAKVTGITLGGGIMMFLAGIVMLLETIFSLRGEKDNAKIMPAWVFAIISLIFGVINLATSLGNGANAVISNIVSLLISVLIFVAANTIKKHRQGTL